MNSKRGARTTKIETLVQSHIITIEDKQTTSKTVLTTDQYSFHTHLITNIAGTTTMIGKDVITKASDRCIGFVNETVAGG